MTKIIGEDWHDLPEHARRHLRLVSHALVATGHEDVLNAIVANVTREHVWPTVRIFDGLHFFDWIRVLHTNIRISEVHRAVKDYIETWYGKTTYLTYVSGNAIL